MKVGHALWSLFIVKWQLILECRGLDLLNEKPYSDRLLNFNEKKERWIC